MKEEEFQDTKGVIDFVDSYGKSVSQMTTDMFHLS
jgi:hypothetical protein